MFGNIINTMEFCVYHLCIVACSRISKIPISGWAKRQDELMRRYLAAMGEIRALKNELVKVKGQNKEKNTTASLKLRCAQALAYILTCGDRIYQRNYFSASRSTAKNWAFIFRHPIKSRRRQNLGGRPKVAEEIIQLIIALKEQNGHWGSPRIKDELLKMGIRLSRATISNILKDNGFDPTGDRANKWEEWKGEYRDHIWSFDFFFVETVREACCMCLVVIDTYTKEILALRVHEGRLGIDSYWVAGTLATTFAKHKRRPANLVHDRDPLFKGQVMRMCSVADIKELIVPPRYPVMQCFVERVIQSIKYELTHHIKCMDGKELQKMLDEYKLWFNNYRPHQGIGGLTPTDFSSGRGHPDLISIEELKNKRLEKITFANGILHAYHLVDDLKKAA